MKKEKEVEEAERSKAHQIFQGGTIRTTGQTWAWGEGKSVKLDVRFKLYSGLYCP